MSIDFSHVNIWAVLVSAVATFMIGGLWYGLLFAKRWVELHGFNEQQVKQMAKKQTRNFGLFFAGDLIMATVISLLIGNLGIQGAGQGALLGVLLWLGIAATIGAAKNAATNKPLAAYVIDTSHELAGLAVMGAILGAWR
ncbi:MAG: DUF1761 domain-containing protein [Planctomycetota bacterium]|nr:DUF1761 domain-containing protein [Planctomycetota bacterium]